MNIPLVSVVIPTYNRAHLLPRSINSVLSQTYVDFELIIVDDSSTDNTEKVVKAFEDKRIIYHKHKLNRGTLAAKNMGWDLAKGEYNCILCDDDELLPEALETAVSTIVELSSQEIKGVWFDTIDARTGKVVGYGMRKEGLIVYEDYLCGRVGGDFWGFMHKDYIGDNRFDEHLFPMESILWIRLHRESKGYYVPKVLYRAYREHSRERVSNYEYFLRHRAKFHITQKVFLTEYGTELKNVCPRQYGRRLAIKGIFDIFMGEKMEGRKTLAESFQYYFSIKHYIFYLLCYFLNKNQIISLASIYLNLLKCTRLTISSFAVLKKLLHLTKIS